MNPIGQTFKSALNIPGRPLQEILVSSGQNNFSLLRLIAATMVVETHSHILLYDNSSTAYFQQQFHFSFLGLPSFFFLSGLLVTQSLHQSTSWKTFLWKRFLRIYPGAWFSLLTTAFILGPAVSTLPLKSYFLSSKLYSFLISLSLVHTNLHLPGVFEHSVIGTSSVNSSLWTISMELKLYLMLVLTGYAIRKFPAARQALLFLIIFAIWFYGQELDSIPAGLRPWFTYGVQFLSGVLCYLYKDRIVVRPILLFVMPILFMVSLRLNIFFYTAYLLIPSTVILFGGFAVTFLQKITPRADLSYGIYIFAFPVQQVIANYIHPSNWLSFFLLSMTATLPLAIVSWYAIEKKALRLKSRPG